MKARRLAFAGMYKRKGHFVDVNKMVPNQKRQKKKAPGALNRAGGMQKGGPLPAPKAFARGTGLVNLLYHFAFKSANIR